jgi:hypothetical protein
LDAGVLPVIRVDVRGSLTDLHLSGSMSPRRIFSEVALQKCIIEKILQPCRMRADSRNMPDSVYNRPNNKRGSQMTVRSAIRTRPRLTVNVIDAATPEPTR